MRQTRAMKAAELLRMVKAGPSFAFEAPFAGDQSLNAPEARKAEIAAREQYRLWAESWIVGAIKGLVPEAIEDDDRCRCRHEARAHEGVWDRRACHEPGCACLQYQKLA